MVFYTAGLAIDHDPVQELIRKNGVAHVEIGRFKVVG
jgi:hypothetical protein